MRSFKFLTIVVISVNLFFSCSKKMEDLNQNTKTTSSTLTKQKLITGLAEDVTDTSSIAANRTIPNNSESLEYLMYLTSPMRDIPANYKRKSINFSNAATVCCNGICGIPASTTSSSFTPQENSILSGTSCIPMADPNGIPISFKAQYGSDPRQIYYIYLPKATYNGKIVILIHGGGWVGGPDPTQVDGWGSDYSTDPNTNLVNNLRDEGFVVISMLYRLVKYGNDDNEIAANDIGFQEQINDIDACVTHVHDNFPSCLNISTNNIQVFGESAGAHLALMFAYTKANTSYVKSVVSAAGPSNLAQFADSIQVPRNSHLFTCGGIFNTSNPIAAINTTSYSNNPYYLPTNAPDPSDGNVVASVNPLNCTVSNTGASIYTRIMNSYRLAQSGVKQVVANPTAAGSPFITFSPCNALVNTRIVPTFIIHGTDDWVVPYSFATNTMSTRLAAVGGLIGTLYSNTLSSLLQTDIPVSYPVSGNRHLIKLYVGGNHAVGNTDALVRPNIVRWLKGH